MIPANLSISFRQRLSRTFLAGGTLLVVGLGGCTSATSQLSGGEINESTSASGAALGGCTEAAGTLCDAAVLQTGMSHDDMNHGAMMDLGPKDAEFDLRFLDGMILHHQGAIEMAEAALKYSQRSDVKALAESILTTQQDEIDQMQAWRRAWYPNAGEQPLAYHAAMGHSMPMSPDMQATMKMSVDLTTGSDGFDRRFLENMIPHHEGALVMAKQVLENSDRPELRTLAEAILTTQQAEIEQMQTWLKTENGQ